MSNNYIWSTSEKVYLRAQALYSIRCIVEQYGGTIDKIDLENYVLEITVPDEHEAECARKVQEVVERME